MPRMISLWDFACNLYQHSEIKKHASLTQDSNGFSVEQACLQLQTQYGINIPLLLFCLWAAKYYPPLGGSQVQRILQEVEQWSTHCIGPLRLVRQQMKTQQNATSYSGQWADIREQVKMLELAAEKQLLSLLEAIVQNDIINSASDDHKRDGLKGAVFCEASLQNISECFAKTFTVDIQSNDQNVYMGLLSLVLCAADDDIQYDIALETTRKVLG